MIGGESPCKDVNMSAEFIARILGMFFFLFLSIGFGLNNVELIGLTGFSPEFVTVLFALVGILIGLIITPYLTTRPLRVAWSIVTGKQIGRAHV